MEAPPAMASEGGQRGAGGSHVRGSRAAHTPYRSAVKIVRVARRLII